MVYNMNTFMNIIDSSSQIRTVVTWFITIGMLILCLFGFIFLVKKAPKLLLLYLLPLPPRHPSSSLPHFLSFPSPPPPSFLLLSPLLFQIPSLFPLASWC